jgi:hypothetical protein
MVTLRLKVSATNADYGRPMTVTSDMLEIIPSPNTVSRGVSGYQLLSPSHIH